MADNQPAAPKGQLPGQNRQQRLNKMKQGFRPVPAAGQTLKKNVKTILGVVFVVLVAAGGYYWYTHWQRPSPAAAASAPAASAPAATVVQNQAEDTYSLSAVTVNLADTDASHLVQIQLVLGYPRSESGLAGELKDKEYLITDKVITDLRAKSYGQLVNGQGEDALKKELLQTVNSVLTKGQLTGVYFKEFLLQ